MTSPSLPAGRYVVAFNQVRTVAGGQTHALLQRTWLFAQEAGVAATIVTFDAYPDYAVVEADLRARGKLHPDVGLRNIYDDHRDREVRDLAGGGEPTGLADLHHLKAVEEYRSDGTLWRTRYDDPGNLKPMLFDYHRSDGSVHLRTPPHDLDELRERPGLVQCVDRSGRVTASYATLGAWWAGWLDELTEDDEDVFLFYDSMMLPPHVSDRLPARFRQVATMHMSHVYHPRRWNSPQHPPARRSLERLADYDALVVLTERQRADVEQAYGARSNLFVLANPGETVDPPDPLPTRDPHLVVVIARLERVKRVDDAVRAFARVVEQVPQARLDVYGEGRQRLGLQDLVRELGLEGSVRLLGHRPEARDRLWEASALLVTSRSEGYPIAPLEAFARGCPVVSYDIKYGPREQVDEGVTGLLARSGDTEAVAEHCVRLLRSPDLVAAMGEAAREVVARDLHLHVSRWAEILQATVAARGHRTRLAGVRLDVAALGWERSGLRRRTIGFRGELGVDGSSEQTPLSAAALELDAVNDADGSTVRLPLEVDGPHDGRFRLASSFDPAEVADEVPAGPVDLRLRLRLTWQNSCWETDLRRPEQRPRGWELSFLDDGAARLRGRR